jgi:hypothetical protein
MPKRYSTRKRKFPRRRRKFPRRGNYSRKRGISKRAILNATSVKKRDKMTLGIVSSNGTVTAKANQEVAVGANSGTYFVSAASYKERVNNANEASRNLRQVYLRGISERVRWETNNTGNPLIVRRMVVSGVARIDLAGGVTDVTTQPTHVVINGNHFIGLGSGPMSINVPEVLFAGTYGQDWTDDMSARLDPRRWKIHSDKVMVVKSGNASEAIMQRRFYDPINKTIQYDDEERGTDVATSGWAAYSTMGHQQNVYIIYFVYNPGTTNMLPTLSLERTLYWHEK